MWSPGNVASGQPQGLPYELDPAGTRGLMDAKVPMCPEYETLTDVHTYRAAGVDIDAGERFAG